MKDDVVGWILDAHLCSAQLEMVVWVATEQDSVVSFREPWHPVLHVSGRQDHLRNLVCLLYTSPSPRDDELSRMPSSA